MKKTKQPSITRRLVLLFLGSFVSLLILILSGLSELNNFTLVLFVTALILFVLTSLILFGRFVWVVTKIEYQRAKQLKQSVQDQMIHKKE